MTRCLDQIVAALSQRTQHVLATAQGSARHARLMARLERLYGALELARVLDDWRLSHRIEAHIDAPRRAIETD